MDKRIGVDGTAVLRRPLKATRRPRGRHGPAEQLLSAPSRSGLALAAERFALAFLPPFLVIGLIVARYAVGKHLGFDYKPLWEASRQVFHGTSPYPPPHAWALHDEQQFVYPPIAAVLAAPLAVFPFGAAAALLAAIELVATGLTLRVLNVRDWRCYGVALLWYPVIQNLLVGSITSLLALGLAVAWRYRDDQRITTPIAAAAITAKIFLWPVLFWLAATRRGLAAARALGLALAAVALSWALIGFAGLTSYPRLLDQLSRLEQSGDLQKSSERELNEEVQQAQRIALVGGAAKGIFVTGRITSRSLSFRSRSRGAPSLRSGSYRSRCGRPQDRVTATPGESFWVCRFGLSSWRRVGGPAGRCPPCAAAPRRCRRRSHRRRPPKGWVGQAFRGLAKTPSRVRISVVTKSHLFAWISLARKARSRRSDSVRARLSAAEGQALVEYALTVSLLAIVCISALTVTGRSLSGILISIAGQV